MTTKNLLSAIASGAVLLACAGPASAANITVGNPSFETPVVPASGNRFVLFPQDVAGVTGAWEQFGNGFKAVYDTATYGGVLTNGVGPQAATIAAGNGSGGLFQEVTSYTAPDPAGTFQAGTTYTLTAGVGRRADSMPITGETMVLRLYFRPADQGAATLLAANTLVVGTTPGLGLTTSGVLTDYSVSYTVPAGSPAIGLPIGIFFDITTAAGITGGDFAVDNVRLTSAVPEPATVSLLGFGALAGGVVCLRRKRA